MCFIDEDTIISAEGHRVLVVNIAVNPPGKYPPNGIFRITQTVFPK